MQGLSVADMMLALCRAALCGEVCTTLPRDDEHMQKLYAVAHHHDMAHIVSYALYRAGALDTASEVGAKLQKAQMLSLFRYEHQRVELSESCRVLEEGGIVHLPLKGSVLRALYPEPWMRTSSDIDLLVHKEDIPRAEALLTEQLGYRKQTFETEHDISLYSPSGVHIELHYDLIEDDRIGPASALLRDVWSYTKEVEGCHYRRAMTDEMFYFYHIAHMAKHFAGGGCGVRTFMDLWLLEQQPSFDAATADVLLAQGELTTFARTARCVSHAWFSGGALDALAKDMAGFVLQGGTYGDKTNYVAIRHMKGENKLSYALSRIFMPYDQLIHTYPSLKGRKYLTFFYQMRRLVRGTLQGKLRGGVSELKYNAQMTDDKAEDMAHLFERLELPSGGKIQGE